MKRLMLALTVAVVLSSMPFERAEAAPKSLGEQMLLLEGRVVDLDFRDRTLDEVLKFFSDLTEVNLVISPVLQNERPVDELRVTLALSRVSVKTALTVICELKGLAAVYRHGVIMITTPKDARGKPQLRLYSIADLTVRIRDFPAPDIMLRPSGAENFGEIGGKEEEGQEHAFADPEFISELITANTGSGTWEDEGVSITANERHLVVRQYPTVHREIDSLLALLRAYR
ncbi:MAG: hypothetical protein MUE73_07115 [Planctomycetes bacterium]|jgi:hypothetical protein|nr:hypothetical protein [Planctomycetota bacterium]